MVRTIPVQLCRRGRGTHLRPCGIRVSTETHLLTSYLRLINYIHPTDLVQDGIPTSCLTSISRTINGTLYTLPPTKKGRHLSFVVLRSPGIIPGYLSVRKESSPSRQRGPFCTDPEWEETPLSYKTRLGSGPTKVSPMSLVRQDGRSWKFRTGPLSAHGTPVRPRQRVKTHDRVLEQKGTSEDECRQ